MARYKIELCIRWATEVRLYWLDKEDQEALEAMGGVENLDAVSKFMYDNCLGDAAGAIVMDDYCLESGCHFELDVVDEDGNVVYKTDDPCSIKTLASGEAPNFVFEGVEPDTYLVQNSHLDVTTISGEIETDVFDPSKLSFFPSEYLDHVLCKGDVFLGELRYDNQKLQDIDEGWETAFDCGFKVLEAKELNECGANFNEYRLGGKVRPEEFNIEVRNIPAGEGFQETMTFTIRGVDFDMVKVEAGTFTMGATPEQQNPSAQYAKPHQVTLTKDYYMGKTQVTQALWQAVMGSNPSEFEGDNKPVENVSWDDCQIFIAKLNAITGKEFRLPTEAEWEFAARGGNKSQHYQYCGSNNVDNVAWYKDNSSNTTHDVATKQPNELGLYDMSGNVCEWCSDWYWPYRSNAQKNPVGPKREQYSRVFRGGSCFGDASRCGSSIRFNTKPVDRLVWCGLRLALSE
jgi:formylglycine-generating enzyme required for sulfatase activity